MATSRNSKTQSQTKRAQTWLKPEQVNELRDAALQTGATYLQERNEIIVAVLYDLGLRVGELVQLDVQDIDLDERELYLPTEKQKDYPIDGRSPPPRHLDIDADLVRDVRRYIDRRWKDVDALLPSRQSDRMTTESVRNVIRTLAREADVRPYLEGGGQGSPDQITPHTLRHSVAYRMLRQEDARLIDVRDRLRHTSTETTEEIYEHF